VSWSGHETIEEVFALLHASGVETVALEQSEKSVDYRQYQPSSSLALFLGNEPKGIDEEILHQCDTIIELPMHGTKQSLNVSVAAGIALYQLIA